MGPWETVILAFGGNAVLLMILGWLSKSLLSQLLEKDVEGFKSALQSKVNESSQLLRHSLEKSAIEHQVRFSKLHERRAEVIAELYGLLVQAHRDMSSFVALVEWTGDLSKKEKYVVAMNAVADFYRFFDKNRIYLPEPVCSKLEEFVLTMREKVIGFGVYVQFNDESMPEHALIQKHDAWSSAWEYFEKKVPEAKSALENEFRGLLGGMS